MFNSPIRMNVLRRGVTVTKTHVTLTQEVNQTTTGLGGITLHVKLAKTYAML